ncbi:MAG TPA: tRNA uridine-5-carboxymethylaminomethyl(34) synthesis enzyme MnmG [Nitrospinota bacterium]|nr:tRNA uridine-5-carboxymethylaminomethyl(34) synthesis enzyme MnmG [Nitrospinota bacterium]
MVSRAGFDVIVVGGGHAACEAALSSARMGSKTLMITINVDQIAQMSCNPAIGGLAKGHLVREIDALGGEMGKCIDATGIQFRMLNRSKGPAVRGPRAQADKMLYKAKMRTTLENQSGLFIKQGQVKKLIINSREVIGVLTELGEKILANSVIVSTGTFLDGLIHIGLSSFPAGRAGEIASIGLSGQLRELGFTVGRLKTGTPARLDGTTIDYAKTELQPGDEDSVNFSFFYAGKKEKQTNCHITHTNETTQQIIEDNLDRSPLYTGVIQGVGPRYCPSIEDKVKRFPEKRRHQVFLEPEGLYTNEIYPNGLSTSLPFDVQLKFLRSIQGLENVEIVRPGYAIEYDFCTPTQLYPTLETKRISGLFFAGQINGTSGYEEAAAQGLVAGINASLRCCGEERLVLTRQNSYIGVLIDDLVTKGTEEPYRMFTSRAEFRLLLRPDNADLRLCDIGKKVGLLSYHDFSLFDSKRKRINFEKDRLKSIRLPYGKLTPADETNIGGKIPESGIILWELLKRPEMCVSSLPWYKPSPGLAIEEAEQLEIECKYEGYIARQEKLVHKTKKSEDKKFPIGFKFSSTPGLSMEVIEKLELVRPISLGQASRISGITPAALSILHIYLEKLSLEQTGGGV